MDPRLGLRIIQSQRLILTPTLQQAIKLLQYSRQELVQYVHQELLENPTLEEVQATEVPQEEGPVAEPSEPADSGLTEGGMENDMEWARYLGEFDGGYEGYLDNEKPSYENIVSSTESLQEHLLHQLNITVSDDLELAAGYQIIGNIDDDGYLRADSEGLAEKLGITTGEVEAIIKKVQQFDPPGVGGRDLTECLLLQLSALGLEGRLEDRLVRYHLKDLEARRLKKIARAEKTTVEEVARAARTIAGLEPRPGSVFSVETVQYVVPDINIYKVDDEYHVQLIEEGLPQLRVSNFYRRLFQSGSLSPTDKEFLDKKVNSAKWLIKSILQRQQTILKVSNSIVKFQREFLDKGIKHLKPLVLRTVAEDIEMHESTVSRVTNKKYAQTPQGLFELKFFFNSGIHRSGGDSMASVSVQELIQKIIGQEDPRRPFSDLEIVRRLKEEHSINIARRTVAKYRSVMNIMPASRRRQVY